MRSKENVVLTQHVVLIANEVRLFGVVFNSIPCQYSFLFLVSPVSTIENKEGDSPNIIILMCEN